MCLFHKRNYEHCFTFEKFNYEIIFPFIWKNVSWYTSLVYTELMNSDKTQILKSYIWYFFASLDTIDKEDVDKQHNIKCLIFGLDAQW